MKIIVVGYGEMFRSLIVGILKTQNEIVGVFRHENVTLAPIDKKYNDLFHPSDDCNFVKLHKLPEIQAKSVNSAEFIKAVQDLQADIIITGSWSEKFSAQTINSPKIACINVHPSLLPKYRGPNPYVQVIKNREKKSGVTIHLIDSGLDSGAILDQREVEILPEDTGKELKAKTALIARGAICELLQKMSEDVVFPVMQKEENATYFSNDFDTDIDFSKPVEETIAQIRAIHPWGRCYFYHKGVALYPNPYRLTVINANTEGCKIGEIVSTDYNDKSITVVCPEGKLLRMGSVNLYGTYKKFLTKGYIRRAVKNGDILN